MAEFQEAFESTGKSVKKLFKNKPFLIAAVGVGVVALFLGYKKYNSEEDSAVGYGAIGYAGYPTVGGAAGDDSGYMDSFFEDIMNQMNQMQESTDKQIGDLADDFTNQLNGVYDEISGLYDEMGSNVGSFGDSYVSVGSISVQKDKKDERQKILDQMQANSDAWHLVGDKNLQQQLQEENQRLGASLGLSYDSQSGTWWDGGSIAYVTPLQQEMALKEKNVGSPAAVNEFVNNVDYQARINEAIMNGADATTINALNSQRNAKIAASGKTVASANTSYDKNTDYAALINKAKESGASQSVIDNLTAQRNAKIAGENLPQDDSIAPAWITHGTPK